MVYFFYYNGIDLIFHEKIIQYFSGAFCPFIKIKLSETQKACISMVNIAPCFISRN
jgi:hypothetical protein